MKRRKPHRALLWAPIALVLLVPPPSSAADEGPPAAQAPAEPAAAPTAEPEAATAPLPAAQPTTAPSEDYKATKSIPSRLLRPLLGCWKLAEQERWQISRLDTNGALVTAIPVHGSKKRAERIPFPGLGKRAAVPATLMYDASQSNFGFSAAGRGPTNLVVFKLSGTILEASLFSRRSSKAPYEFSGYSATLDRCKAGTRKLAPGARPAPVPPRLK